MNMSFLTGFPRVRAAQNPAVPASVQPKAGQKYPPHVQNVYVLLSCLQDSF